MGSMGRKQGEQVSLSYSDTAIQATPTPIGVYDANGVLRTLQPYERLILDVVSFDTEASDTTNLAYIVAGGGGSLAAPTQPASGSVPPSPIVASFTVAQGLPDQGIVFPAEGESLPVGAVPYLVVPGTGISGFSVTVTGTGRVINGKSQGKRPNWQCPLTPGGTN